MEVKDCIKIFDNVINQETLDVIVKWANDIEFQNAEIVNNQSHKGFIDKNTRTTFVKNLAFNSQSMTEIHWAHIFTKIFKECINAYLDEYKIPSSTITKLEGTQILKYEPGGHYTWHVDHGIHLNRKVSCIFYLNEGYEGGKIQFAFPSNDESLEVEPKKNRMIVWPSNFLFPHRVTPVEKGTRYSAVCWAV